MRTVAIALSLAAVCACAHRQPAAEGARAEEGVSLPLPAAFEGRLSNGDRGALVLLDPARYVLLQRNAVTLIFRHGTWEREGADAIALTGATPGRFRILDADRLTDALAQPAVDAQEVSLDRQALPALVAGMATRRHGRIFFERCAGGTAVPLVDATGALDQALGDRAAPVYAELLATAIEDGTVLGPPAAGEELLAWEPQRIQAEEARCERLETGRVATAIGHEPDWKLEVDTRSVRLHRMGADPIGAPWAPFRWEGGAYRYRADTGDVRWDVALRPVPCTDAMVEARYAWTAEVRVNETTLRGCAHLGTEWQRLHGG